MSFSGARPPRRRLTAWRLSTGPHALVCHLTERATGVRVSVVRDGRRVDGVFCDGPGDESLHRAWHEAVALYERYRGVINRGAERPAEAPTMDGQASSDDDVMRALRSAVERVEGARASVAPLVRPGAGHSDRTVRAVNAFREAWETLDLEFHYLIGRPLSPNEYERRFAGLVSRLRLSPHDG